MTPSRSTSPSRGPASPRVTGFHEAESGSVQYVVADPATGQAALIDMVLDFDPAAGATATRSAEAVLDFVAAEGLTVAWILDTHPHADHLMAAHWLRTRTGAPMAIGARVHEIAELWAGLYHLPDAFDPGRDFDRLLGHGETLALGETEIRVMLSPGHTLGSVSYLVGADAAFVHDTFLPVDAGTARADFPGGSARALWGSLQAILALPDATRLFVGHDYGTKTRDTPAWEATVAEQRASNAHIGTETCGRHGQAPSAADFIALRETRDATLPLPQRMLHALQVNLRGGRLPEPEADGQRYLKIPVNRFQPA